MFTWNVHYRSCLFIKRFGPHHQFHSEIIVTKRLHSNNAVFKFWSHMFFFLLLEAITIPAVNCTTSFMRESSVTRNALWERFKMVDNRKTVMFFSKFHLDRSSVIENCCTSRESEWKNTIFVYFDLSVWIYQDMSLGNYFLVPLF